MAPKKQRKKKWQPYQREQASHSEDNLKFMRDEIDKRFNKKFTLKTKKREFILPESDVLFTEEPFVISELLALKDELNSTKSLLNDMDIEEWHQHTRKTHAAGLVVRQLREQVQAEMCTQAWAKMYEILGSYNNLIPQEALQRGKMLSVHLCEAPGAFLSSLNHYIRNHFHDLRWEWLASTLNPYYEGNDLNAMLDDDTFIIETLENWNFGLDGTGDLMKLDNLKHLKQASEGKGSVDLVTADGSINCADEPAEQEKVVGQLIFCETIAALNLLSQGGTYIFKMFTALECYMICMMYLLCCLFEEVHVIKPGTSKSGNSEVYVACIGYAGSLPTGYHEILCKWYDCSSPNKALFALKFIPVDFLDSLKKYQNFFIGMQMNEIKVNIRHFQHMSKIEKKQLFQLKNQVALHYISLFDVRPIEEKDHLVSGLYLDGIQRNHVSVIATNEHFGKRRKAGSYNERHQGPHHGWLESVREDEVLACIPSYCINLKGFCQANDGIMLIPLYPEEVEWLQQTVQGVFHGKMTFGRTINEVRNSRFCSPIYIAKLKDAIENASILAPSRSSDLAGVIQQISALSLSSSEHNSCRYCNDSTSVLDKLVAFTDLKRKESICKALVLYSQEHCQCFKVYLRSKDILVKDYLFKDDGHFDKKFTEEPLERSQFDILVVPYYPNVPINSFESIHMHLELITKQELLISCISAVKTLKQGGTFVCRLYNSMTRFTVGLLYILHRLFRKMTIAKPVVGALWHPERFLVCKGYKGCNQELISHLEKVHKALNDCKSIEDLDVLEVVDIHCLYEEKFFSFVMKINEQLAHLQLLNMVRLETFYYFPGEIPVEEERIRLRQEMTNYFNK